MSEMNEEAWEIITDLAHGEQGMRERARELIDRRDEEAGDLPQLWDDSAARRTRVRIAALEAEVRELKGVTDYDY